MPLRPFDLSIIVAYLAGVVALGWYFSRGQKDLRDYFLSDHGVPWWAIAASIVATETSVVTFISVPAFAFAPNSRGEGGNFTFLQLVVGYLVGRLIIVTLFIPLYFRGELFTVYEILDRRFGGQVKRIAASLFILTRSLSDGVRLYATAIPLVALTGWPDWKSILVIGAVMIVFTYLGGVTAVIWVEVIQLVIYNAGAIAAGIVLLNLIPGGLSEVATVGNQFGRLQLFDFTVELARSYTFWAGVIGGAFLTTSTHGTDQFMVQRYLCAKSSRQASKALLASWVVVLIQFAMFLLIGVMLFVFYNLHQTLPADIGGDRVFSHFIVNQLPTGAVGLVIAAMIAAAMSSSLNALASTTVTDFYKPLIARARTERHYLKASRVITALWGIVQIAAAMYVIGKDRRIVDTVLSIASFTNGPILGVFLLGALTRRVGPAGALAGVISGIVVMVFVWARLDVSWQWYVLIGSAVTFVVGYSASIVFESRSVSEEPSEV